MPSPSRCARSGQPLTRSQRRVIAVVLTGMLATTFPVSILTVSLPLIAKDMSMSTSAVTWVLTAPLLALAIATPILGRLGDLRGHRRIFIAGFTASTALALATALAWNGPSLIALRTLGQLCGAATSPSGMAIMLAVVRREDRLRVISLWSIVAALSPTLGLVIGGPLIDAVGWRAVFLVQSLPAAVCVVLAVRLLPATPKLTGVTFDVAGTATLGSAIFALMFGLDRGAVLGWSSAVVVTSLALCPILLVCFVRLERRCPHPLLPIEMLTRRNVASPLAAQPFIMGPFQGAGVVAPFLLASEFGFGTTAITFVALARTASFGVFGGAAGRLGERLGERHGAAIGTALVVASMGVLALSANVRSVALLVVGMLLLGGGGGFARPPFTAALANAVDESQIGIATASMNLTTLIGQSIGITAMTTVLSATEGTDAFVIAFAVGALIAAVSVFFALRLDSLHRVSQRLAPAPVVAAD